MSSPKRAAKGAAKAGAKSAVKAGAKPAKPAARRARPARPVAAVAKNAAANGATAEVKNLAATLDRILVDGELDVLPADALQTLIAAACRLYRARREAGEDFAPVPKNSISATDAMVTASGLLKALDLAVFELGMWQNWTGR